MSALTAVFCLLAGFSAAVAEVVGKRSEHGVLKMLASTSYLVFALELGALGSVYGQLILAGLLLSWFGDLFLISTGRLFLVGLAAFLVAHLAYAAAFVARGVSTAPAVIGAAAMVAVGLGVLRWLHEAELPGEYGIPVAAYIAAIGAMVALAVGTAWTGLVAGGEPAVVGRAVILGAGAFAVSDIMVARHRFVKPDPWNRLVGLPLYFAAQLLLASSV